MNWWRLPKKEPTIVDLIKRIEQLERALQHGRGRTLYSYMMDYDPLDHPGIVRDESSDRVIGTIPGRVQDWLDKAKESRMEGPYVMGSGTSWRDTLTPKRVIAADGTQVLNTVTETVMCPDFTFAADYFEVGDAVKYTLLFDVSTIAGAQTQTYRIRWGGVGGTALAASGAFQGDTAAVATNLSQAIEWYVVCRSAGPSGSMFAMGKLMPADFNTTTIATLAAQLNMFMVPPATPASVGSLNTTAANALSPTITFSVATATVQLTNHMAFLESMN
jgi:hypothetical protein